MRGTRTWRHAAARACAGVRRPCAAGLTQA